MAADFERAVAIIIDLEGGDKVITDSGGLTKYGISQRAYPDLDIRNLTLDDAKEIYLLDYWSEVRANCLSWPLNVLVFDAAVNQGSRAAGKMLQDAAGGLALDGILGRKSMARIQSRPPKELAALFMAKRALRYSGTKHYDKYGYGWLARMFRLMQRI